jgi:hypothetical protein
MGDRIYAAWYYPYLPYLSVWWFRECAHPHIPQGGQQALQISPVSWIPGINTFNLIIRYIKYN